MSIVNNAHPGSSLVLLNLIDRYLLARGKPVSRVEMLTTLRPDNLPLTENAEKRFEWNLNFWLEQGLWATSEDGAISLVPNPQHQDLPTRLLAKIVSNTSTFKDDEILEGSRTEPFLRAITSLLPQRAFTFLGGKTLGSSNAAEVVNNFLPGKKLNETNELSGFLAFADFLGFLEPVEKAYVIDPTRAIKPYLPTIFSDEGRLPIKTVVERLGVYLPMLDGGRYRRLIEPLMEGFEFDEPYEISAALSHALVRLESSFQIRLERPSDDSTSLNLQLPGQAQRSVGEVHYISQNNE
ncbi:protein DpdG [Paraburkholderia diazotrophica]|uniref:Uncharacterized protein n=1 Tax=Paraburkholderia diazotrophica TaxID=667676 RepID=A0A1H6RJM1_9BURK|nr:protein DpdG [Paraburkholderia diazotrophica]SEI52010.1 hypothetical protein SAMN05192539_1002144 [Paraburkholderia diazotrophica]